MQFLSVFFVLFKEKPIYGDIFPLKNPVDNPFLITVHFTLQHSFCNNKNSGRKHVVELLSKFSRLKERKQYRYSGETEEEEAVEPKEQEKVQNPTNR